jgi:hypothetical protein
VTNNTTTLSKDIVTKDFDPWFSDDAAEKAYARGVCKVCPQLATCTIFGLVNDPEFGIFGGLDPDERKPVREKMEADLPAETVAALRDKYFVPEVEPAAQALLPSVEAKYRRREARAEYCFERLNETHPDDIRRYSRYMDCVVAVLDSPSATGADLGKALGISSATFNQYLRECFEYFKLDLSVL